MSASWQSIAAVAVVLLTLAVFVARMLRPAKKRGCGHDCGCGKKESRP